ncbi:hypothetical protein V2J09_001377 [Rumex salicifolius]
MPPEPLPWDRKDFFREKKHGNAGYDRVSEPLGGSSARWRDTPSHGSRNDFGRWGFPSDFRRPPVHSKQGSWHLYQDDLSHEYPTARSGERFFQGAGGFRPSGPYRDNRYNRNFRESRTSINQRDWRGNSYDYNHHHGAPSSGPGRLCDGRDQKSAEAAPARLSRPPMDVANTSNLVHPEEQRDESCDVNKADTCRGVEKEEPLASNWKPFKWSRPVSLTSRGPVICLSSSSKGSGESCDVKFELPLKICTPDESSSGDALGCLASPTSMEDTTSRKKPRLGWGEGLAKFEKKRVDPDDPQSKSSSAQCTSNIEPMHSPVQNWADKSPRFGGFFECRSPTTPSSVAYSSSPGLDDKFYMKASEIESDGSKLSLSSIPIAQNLIEGVSLNLEDMDSKAYSNLNGLLTELLQKEDYSSIDSGITKSALNKLLSWKGDISKVLESTESEIDSLENELKSLTSVPGSNNPVSNPSSSFSMECQEKNCAELNGQMSHSLPAVSSGNLPVGDMVPNCDVGEDALKKTKDDCIDSPGTATSKFTELLSLNKPSSSNQLKPVHSMDVKFLESDKYEACSSVHVRDIDGTSGPESETKMVSGIAAGHDNMVVSKNLEDKSLDYILFSNKGIAFEASKLLEKLLPSSDCVIESIETISSTCSHNKLLKDTFLKRKQALRFKERVLSMKYRAFQYMWKEDLQQLAERKQRTTSQKKVESCSRSLHSGFQKHRSSVRSRLTSPARNLNLVPTSEIVSFTRKLLSDPQIRCYRDDMKMPPLILDKKEKMLSGFLSNNGLVQDPYAVEKERALMNPWTAEEKEIFLDQYAAFGKDFTKISSFLDHKTTADCIEFYYKNHKSDCFMKAKKQQVLKKQETSAPTTRYLITSEKWNREMNAASLDMLGAISAIVAHGEEGTKSAKILSIGRSERKVKEIDGLREMSSRYDIDDERETEAADVLAGICGSLSSEAMSSCITSSADPGDGTQDWKSWKTSSEPSGTRCPPTAEVTQNVDDDTCSDESCGYVEPVDWTDEEKSSFVQAFSSYGKDFEMISRCVQTKSRDQCKVFFSKARKCLGLEMLCSDLGDEEMQTADDLDGGQSDTEGACVVENDLATCGDNASVGTDENTPMPISKLYHEVNDMDNDFKERSQIQDCQQERIPDVPDDGAVLNEGVETAVRLQCHVNIDSDCGGEPTKGHGTVIVTDEVGSDTSPTNQQPKVVAEIAREKPQVDLKSVSLDNQEMDSAPFGSELKRSASVNDLHQRAHGQSSSDFGEYSSPKLSMQQIERSRVSSLLPSSHTCAARTEASGQPLQVYYLKKCQRSASIQSIGESGSCHQQQLSDTSAKSCKNVKLFGQILSKPSTTDKPASDISSNSGCVDMLPINKEMDKYALSNGSLGLENFPPRRYGFWEGNRTQTGHPTIPDSALIVARYPGIFNTSSLPTSTSEQKLPLLASVASSNHNVGFADYLPLYPTEQGKIHLPYRLEMNPLSEVPRNGFEAVPGLKQIELNVVDSDARSVGSCNDLTDPVAALKLHYAKTCNQSGVNPGGGYVGR